MRNESTISKWGNSLAVRIPLAIAKQASLAEGDCVKLTLGRKIVRVKTDDADELAKVIREKLGRPFAKENGPWP